MSFTFTGPQLQAIGERGGSILVSAAAGSGKTRVLTERLVRRVTAETDPADIDRFLVITYTRAAAAELRARILEELAKAAAAHPEDRRLRRQQDLCCRARIGTIHAFCTDVIRENCHLLGLPPTFRVLEEERAAALKANVVARVLERRYAAILGDAPFRALVDTVGAGRDDSRLVGAVLSLYEKLRSHPYPADWAEEQKRALLLEGEDDISGTPWGALLLADALRDVRWIAGELETALGEIGAAGGKLESAYAPAFSSDLEGARALEAALRSGWDAACAAFGALAFARLGAAPRNAPDPELQVRLKAKRDLWKDRLKSWQSVFSAPSARQLADLRAMAPAMTALLDLAAEFGAAYDEEKRRRGVLDFSDLEHGAVQLLVDRETGAPTWIAAEYASRFEEVMVDEYQDVNAVQEMIFRAVSREGRNLFLVGDVKQSIYRFRLADPTLFLRKYRDFVPVETAAEGEPRRILLRENFRSRRCVLAAANSVFSNIMSEALGELDYDGNAALRFGAVDYGETPDTPAELCILDAADAAEEGETPQRSEQEARYVARRIAQMLRDGEPVTEGGAQRPCRPQDFALLLRSPGANGAAFHRALAEAGIPVQSRQGTGYFTSLEVTVAIDLLSLIDNPHADVPLISALRSPVFGFTPDELSAVRAASRDTDFYTALLAAAEAGDAHCAAFRDLLARWRASAADLGLEALLWRICGDTDLFAVCAAMDDGDARRRNLMRLVEYARTFSEDGFRTPSRFVAYLRRLAEKGTEPDVAGGGDAVRILSIHKSKGLEFPFVFLCDLGHQFNRNDLRESVLMHASLGLGPKFTDPNRGVEYPTVARRAIERKLWTETLSEEMRVLYVGMTRARERLIMTCIWKNAPDALEKLRLLGAAPVPPAVLRAQPSLSRWLALAALQDPEALPLRIAPAAEEADAEPAARETPAADEDAVAALRADLAFTYPFAGSVGLPSRLTATELKRTLDGAERAEDAMLVAQPPQREFRPVRLGGAQALTAAERGTATHTFLQYLDLSKAGTAEGLGAELQRIAAAGRLTPEEAAAVDLAAVGKLFAAPLGREMAAAAELRREFRFTLLADARGSFPEAAADDRILLQGVVDCFFVTEDGVTIVDYKTDRVTEDEIPARAERYRVQLRTYVDALRRILGLPVRRCVLWFLRPGAAFELPAEDV